MGGVRNDPELARRGRHGGRRQRPDRTESRHLRGSIDRPADSAELQPPTSTSGDESPGSNFELGGAASITAEHNVIIGSSWPVRGVGGEFRYNLVLEAGHQWLWADHDNAYVHHNVFAGGDNDVGGIYVLYGVKNVRIQNNTIDGLDGGDLKTGVNVSDGSVSLTSNLFFRVPKTPVLVGLGSVSADYNLSWASAVPTYSDGRSPAHDVAANPQLLAPTTTLIDFDETRLWART